MKAKNKCNFFTKHLIFSCVLFILACGTPKKKIVQSNWDFKPEYICSFAKLYGYVAYFHPTTEAMSMDWDKFLTKSIAELDGIKTDSAFKNKLLEIFNPVCYDLKIHITEPILDTLIQRNPEDLFYIHYGLEERDINIYQSIVKNLDSCELETKPKYSTIKKEIGKNLWITLPIIIPKDYQIETDSFYQREIESVNVDFSNAEDEVTQLASFIKTWNIFNHFYPYNDIANVDMSVTLFKNVSAICLGGMDTYHYSMTLAKFLNEMQDGHGTVYHSLFNEFHYLPFICERIEGKVCVVNSFDERIIVGDEILSISGIPIEQIFNFQMNFYSGSFQHRQNLVLSFLFPIQTTDIEFSSSVSIRRGLEIYSFSDVNRSILHNDISRLYREKEEYKIINEGLYYINLTSIRTETWQKILPEIEKKDLIFDLRGYASELTLDVLGHISTDTINSPKWEIPIITSPDFENVVFDTSNWKISPKSPHFSGKIVFLCNEEAGSATETCLDIVSHYQLGYLVGSNTVGVNGNMNCFQTPGGFHVCFTGMKVRKRDGSPLHLVGIKPDFICNQSINGVLQGKDDVLEFAIKLLCTPNN